MLHDKRRLLLIAGPCSLENEANCRAVAQELRALAERPGVEHVSRGEPALAGDPNAVVRESE
ncbi:MAG: hypothetical protein ACKORI_01365, partial [Verrucomicrobiota bacterium]